MVNYNTQISIRHKIVTSEVVIGKLTSLFSIKVGYIGHKVWGVDCSARLRMANDTATSESRCLFVQRLPTIGKDRGRLIKVIMLAPTTGWKLANNRKAYLSVPCRILCNCCSSVPMTYQCLMTLLFNPFRVSLALECIS